MGSALWGPRRQRWASRGGKTPPFSLGYSFSLLIALTPLGFMFRILFMFISIVKFWLQGNRGSGGKGPQRLAGSSLWSTRKNISERGRDVLPSRKPSPPLCTQSIAVLRPSPREARDRRARRRGDRHAGRTVRDTGCRQRTRPQQMSVTSGTGVCISGKSPSPLFNEGEP